MENINTKLSFNIRKYYKVMFVSFLSIILYILAAIYNNQFVNIMSVASYLTWHSLFEFASVLVSFSLFTVTYFV